MSLTGPTASSQPPRAAADGEPSTLAPRWPRSGVALRKVIPLHLPAAPQLVPGAAPLESAAAAAPRGAKLSGPELLAEDAVLKKLLQRSTPEPQPAAVKPVRDPLGLALGMVARLVVAGCGVAAVVMLLLGIIPSPLHVTPFATSEVAPAATVSATETKADAVMPIQLADAGTSDGVAAPASAVTPARTAAPAPSTAGLATADAVPPEAARVPAAPVRAAQARPVANPTPTEWALEPGEVERLIKRGEDYLAQGDIAAARLILGRAAEARDARAAFSLGATYDPSVLRQLHVVGFRPDVAQARAWYEKAAEYGSAEASRRLAALPSPGQ